MKALMETLVLREFNFRQIPCDDSDCYDAFACQHQRPTLSVDSRFCAQITAVARTGATSVGSGFGLRRRCATHACSGFDFKRSILERPARPKLCRRFDGLHTERS